jgi:hypothetical protein
MKRRASFGDCTNFDNDGVQGINVIGITPNMIPPSNFPQGCKRVKKDWKAKKQTKNSIINAQAHAIIDMVVVTLERTTIIQDQNMMVLFSMLDD